MWPEDDSEAKGEAVRIPCMSWNESDRLLEGARFDVYAFDLSGRDGGSHRREVVVSNDAVVVLPLLEDSQGEGDTEPRVVLIRNERFAVGKTLLELPAGVVEAREDPSACAGRELTEETGYAANAIEPMTCFHTSPGFCTEWMHAFLATGLHYCGQRLEDTEDIQVEIMPWSETLACVRDGRIEDAKTIAALLWHAQFRRVDDHTHGGAGH